MSIRKIGIIGSSKITRYHLSALSALLPEANFRILGNHIESLNALKQYATNIDTTVSLQEFSQDHYDLIVVTTKTENHFDSCLQALKLAKKIVVEKPAVCTHDQWVHLKAAAALKKVDVLVVGQKRYSEELAKLLDVVMTAGPVSRVDIQVHKKRDQQYFNCDTDSKYKTITYTQLPHYIDIVGLLLAKSIRLIDKRFLSVKQISGVSDYFHGVFASSSSVASIEVSTFMDENYPIHARIYFKDFFLDTQNFHIVYDSRGGRLKNAVYMMRSRGIDSAGQFVAMYRDYFANWNRPEWLEQRRIQDDRIMTMIEELRLSQ